MYWSCLRLCVYNVIKVQTCNLFTVYAKWLLTWDFVEISHNTIKKEKNTHIFFETPNTARRQDCENLWVIHPWDGSSLPLSNIWHQPNAPFLGRFRSGEILPTIYLCQTTGLQISLTHRQLSSEGDGGRWVKTPRGAVLYRYGNSLGLHKTTAR